MEVPLFCHKQVKKKIFSGGPSFAAAQAQAQAAAVAAHVAQQQQQQFVAAAAAYAPFHHPNAAGYGVAGAFPGAAPGGPRYVNAGAPGAHPFGGVFIG